MLHRSKKNNSNNRKSIISFNCDFYDVILKWISKLLIIF
jgi:hypothetical protein